MIRNQRNTRIKFTMAKKLRQEITPAEKVFWNAVKGNKVAGLHFRRQQIIDGFIADFYCHKLKLVVEIDGGVHEKQKDYDKERDRIIKTHDITIWRFKNEAVISRLESIVGKIVEYSKTLDLTPSPSLEGRGVRGWVQKANLSKPGGGW